MMRYLTLLLCMLTSTLLYGQAQIDFFQSTYDYGTLREEIRTANATFDFVNRGNAPLLIHYANTSCGCTVPSYPKTPIAVGDTGRITVTYHTIGRPGTFIKRINLYTNAVEPVSVLTIKGDVLPEGAESLDKLYPMRMGELQLQSVHLPFFKLYRTQLRSEVIKVRNSSKQPLTLSASQLPSHIKVTASPSTLKSEEVGEVIVTYDGRAIDDWGVRRDSFLLSTGKTERYITVMAELSELFDPSKEAMAAAPRIHLNRGVVQLGEIQQGSSATAQLTLTNGGKQPLYIRKIKNLPPWLKATPAKEVIAPSESITVRLTTDKRLTPKGEIDHRIQLISNDPTSPTSVIRLTGWVE